MLLYPIVVWLPSSQKFILHPPDYCELILLFWILLDNRTFFKTHWLLFKPLFPCLSNDGIYPMSQSTYSPLQITFVGTAPSGAQQPAVLSAQHVSLLCTNVDLSQWGSVEHWSSKPAHGQEALAYQRKGRLALSQDGKAGFSFTGHPKREPSLCSPTLGTYISHKFLSPQKIMSSFWVHNSKDHILFIIVFWVLKQSRAIIYVFPLLSCNMFTKEPNMYRQAELQQWAKQNMVPALLGLSLYEETKW